MTPFINQLFAAHWRKACEMMYNRALTAAIKLLPWNRGKDEQAN